MQFFQISYPFDEKELSASCQVLLPPKTTDRITLRCLAVQPLHRQGSACEGRSRLAGLRTAGFLNKPKGIRRVQSMPVPLPYRMAHQTHYIQYPTPIASKTEGILAPMSECTIELTPSISGWYFAASTVGMTPRIGSVRETSERSAPDPVQDVAPACIGYGPDGLPYLSAPRASVSLLA
jgi:hypothetical protein